MSKSVTLTVHRALDLITKTNDKLEKTMSNGLFINTSTKTKPSNRSFKTVEELKQRLQGDYDSVITNLENYSRLKEAVALSNLQTKVTFLGQEVSIVRLLAIKQTLGQRQMFLRTLRNQNVQADKAILVAEQQVLEQMKGQDPASQESARTHFENTIALDKVTGFEKSPDQIIKDLEESISLLDSEVDTLLSESNIKTELTVELV